MAEKKWKYRKRKEKEENKKVGKKKKIWRKWVRKRSKKRMKEREKWILKVIQNEQKKFINFQNKFWVIKNWIKMWNKIK